MFWLQNIKSVRALAMASWFGWLCVVGSAQTAGVDRQLQSAAAGRTVLASVVDARSRPLVAVEPDDFVITENGQPREVLEVHIADYPVVVLVDDAVTEELLVPMKSAVARFIGRIGERPVAVQLLSHTDGFAASFDEQRADVLKRVDAITPDTAATAPALASMSYASRALREAGVPFSAIVVVTAHAIGTASPVSADVVAAIVDSGASVQVVIVRGATDTPDAAQNDLLRVLAGQTRGQYTPIFSAASFAIALDRIADRMASEVMIQYVAPAGTAAGDVKVGTRIAGARVTGLGAK
jgi:hypothetical protein